MAQKFYKLWLTAFLLVLSLQVLAAQNTLTSAKIEHFKSSVRLVLSFKNRVSYHTFALTNPNRYVIDLKNTHEKADLKKLALNNLPIKDIRTGIKKQSTLRIVLDMRGKYKIHSHLLKAIKHNPYRLEIEIPVNNNVITWHQPKKLRDLIIVIDPGHGGKDPGATGPNGIHEKNVVLKVSKDLQSDLNKVPGVQADLTRTGDYYLTLRDRLRIARKDKADFFIAIHADAYKNTTEKGASVFALSERGATSEAARWLAERENYSELGGVKDFSHKSRMLRSVLLDLSQTATISQSLRVGYSIIHSLHEVTVLHNDSVEQARFVVLKSPDIPSLLVETGFITNPFEEHRLNTASYQNKLAKALAAGLVSFFHEHPPRGTFFAAVKNIKHYDAKSGDTLSTIAKSFNITTDDLKQFNHLRSDKLYIKEKLLIPKTHS